MKAKIRLDTMKDITRFVNLCSNFSEPIYISDGNGLRVSAKSILGVMYSMEFADIWCESDMDIYTVIQSFIID